MKSMAFWAGSFSCGILRHAVGFAEGDRREAVAIEPDAAVGVVVERHEQVAVFFLALDEEVEAAADHVLVLKLAVVVARPLKRDHRQGGGGRVAGELRVLGKALQPPAAVGRLIAGQERQAALDRFFGLRRGAAAAARRLVAACGERRGW